MTHDAPGPGGSVERKRRTPSMLIGNNISTVVQTFIFEYWANS